MSLSAAGGRSSLPAALLLSLAAATVTLSAAPPPPLGDVAPPEWTALTVRWMPTWTETLAANSDEDRQKELASQKPLAQAIPQIVGLRRIQLLEAMIQRFPADKDRHAEAWREMALVCRRIGLPDRARWCALKLAAEFPHRRDLQADAYVALLSGGPVADAADWEAAVQDALTLAHSDTLPAGHPLARAACLAMTELMVQHERYDLMAPQLKRFEALGVRSPGACVGAARLLWSFGYVAAACQFDAKAPSDWKSGDLDTSPAGVLDPRPRDPDLDSRWESLLGAARLRVRKGPIQPEDIQKVLDLSSQKNTPFEKTPSHWVSGRIRLDELLATLPPEDAATLRDVQDRSVRPLARQLRDTGDWNALRAASARYPWARSLHELLLEFGERDLARGQMALAPAAFRDVLLRAADPELRDAARAALLVALAQTPGPLARGALDDALAAVPAGAALPWRGRRVSPARLRQDLLATADSPAPPQPPLASRPRRRIQLPPSWPDQRRKPDGPLRDHGLHAPWPVSGLQLAGDTLLVSGHGRLAAFAPSAPGPLWTRATGEDGKLWNPRAAVQVLLDHPGATLDRRPVATAAAPMSPDGRTLFCVLPDPPAIAALDAETGHPLWTSAARPDWGDLIPMSHPALAQDRLYVLAVPAGLAPEAGGGPGTFPGQSVLWHLVCLDPRDGRPLWKQPLAWQPYTLLDLARASATVTVGEGAVYCSTNMGLLARCDARNGGVDWIRAYPPAIRADWRSPNFAREGSSPLLAGDLLLAAPRDHAGVLAIRKDTGEMAWENRFAPSDKLVGLAGRALIAANSRWLTALDAATGQPLWLRHLPEGVASRAVLAGNDVLLLAGAAPGPERLLRIASATGATVEELPLPPNDADDRLLLADGSLADVCLSHAPDARLPLAAGLAGPLGNSFQEVRSFPFERPTVIAPEGPNPPASFLVLSGRRLACIKAHPAWAPAWERTLPQVPQRLWLRNNQLLLTAGPALWALNPADGTPRWALTLPFTPRFLGSDGDLAFAAATSVSGSWAAVIDSAAGRLLWARSVAQPLRSRSSLAAATLRPDPAGAILGLYWPEFLFADEGPRPAEMTLDARTGQHRRTARFLPNEDGWPLDIHFDPDALRYVGRDGRPHVIPHAGGADPLARWTRRADLTHRPRYPAFCAVLGSTPSGPHLRGLSQLFLFDSAAGREILFDLPPNPLVLRARVPQPRTHLIYDAQEAPGLLLVLSATTGDAIINWGKYWRDASDPKWAGLLVDVFDRPTGRHLGSQQLGKLPWCTFASHGHDTQARFLGPAVLATTPDALHLFLPSAGGTKISDPPPPPATQPTPQPKRPPIRKGRK